MTDLTQEQIIEQIKAEQVAFDEEFGNFEKVEIGQTKTFLFAPLVYKENPKVEKKEGDYGEYLAYQFLVRNLNTKTQKEKTFSCTKKLADAIFEGLGRGFNTLDIIRKNQNQYQVVPAAQKKEKAK